MPPSVVNSLDLLYSNNTLVASPTPWMRIIKYSNLVASEEFKSPGVKYIPVNDLMYNTTYGEVENVIGYVAYPETQYSPHWWVS